MLYAPLRWRQGALISKTPCSECMIRNIHKINSTNNILFICFPWYPLVWATCNNISQEKWKTEMGFFNKLGNTLAPAAFEFSKRLVNFYASVMTTSKYTRIFCPVFLMYSYSLPLRIQWWVLFYFCLSPCLLGFGFWGTFELVAGLKWNTSGQNGLYPVLWVKYRVRMGLEFGLLFGVVFFNFMNNLQLGF